MTDILIVPEAATEPYGIEITDEGKKLKGQLIIRCAGITEVTSIKQRDGAIVTAATLKKHLKEVEAARQEVLKPFHAVVAAINAAARDHVKELGSELKRVNGLVGDFELERQKQEYMAKQEAATQLQAVSQEAAKAPEGTKTPAKALEAALEAEERVGAATEKLDTVLATQEANKPTGGALRKDWDVEIKDLKALYTAHPQCVSMKANLLAIKDLLKIGITPPGVLAIPKVSYAARSK